MLSPSGGLRQAPRVDRAELVGRLAEEAEAQEEHARAEPRVLAQRARLPGELRLRDRLREEHRGGERGGAEGAAREPGPREQAVVVGGVALDEVGPDRARRRPPLLAATGEDAGTPVRGASLLVR